jgi:hypothetical protein
MLDDAGSNADPLPGWPAVLLRYARYVIASRSVLVTTDELFRVLQKNLSPLHSIKGLMEPACLSFKNVAARQFSVQTRDQILVC